MVEEIQKTIEPPGRRPPLTKREKEMIVEALEALERSQDSEQEDWDILQSILRKMGTAQNGRMR